jgi:lauroyl/myristoyl acyltransferase
MTMPLPHPRELRDFSRWMLWKPLRDRLSAENPDRIRSIAKFWPAAYYASIGQRKLMADEYSRCFPALSGAEIQSLVKSAYKIAWRTHLEELVLGKLDADTLPNFLTVNGQENLQAALSLKKGALILSPHAGNFMLPIAALSILGYNYTQYAARGLPPQEMIDANPHLVALNKWAVATREIREANEDALPAHYLTLHKSARDIFRTLKKNHAFGIAFDGRVGTKWVQVEYLGRMALLNSGPYRLSASTGAPIVPTFTHTPEGIAGVCDLGEPIYPEGRDWKEIMTTFLRERIEPWLSTHPEEYGVWLSHSRSRVEMDDHPLFIDNAVDERWRRYPTLENA